MKLLMRRLKIKETIQSIHVKKLLLIYLIELKQKKVSIIKLHLKCSKNLIVLYLD